MSLTLGEALLLAGDENWFRPVSWRDSGQAFCVVGNSTKLVPTPRGGVYGMTSSATDLTGDWEVVTPGMVNEERE